MGAITGKRSATNGNLRVTGSSMVGGGHFDKVKVVGEAMVEGDLTCTSLSCIGTMEMTGRLQGRRLGIVGTCAVTGSVQAESLKNSGTVTISEDAVIHKLMGSGLLEVKGQLTAKEVDVKGHIATAGDFEADQLRLRGMFDVGGLLNAGTLDIKLYQKCKANEIGGERIEIRKASLLHPFSLFFRPLASAKLTVGAIEGDDIYVEHTHADVIRGTKVRIGPGCKIGVVEYREELTVSKDAEVANKRQV
ncbi:cytoplasmic protein [Paenibacillus oryzisoli]|uniref:cytoplasmic protein n=1 Tax=Paenibacillus oryzisoli TaxID=1850517 RepID=UPI003D2B6A52